MVLLPSFPKLELLATGLLQLYIYRHTRPILPICHYVKSLQYSCAILKIIHTIYLMNKEISCHIY